MNYSKAALVVNFSQDSDDVVVSPLKRKRESAAGGADRAQIEMEKLEHKYQVLIMQKQFLLGNCAIQILCDGVP
jgi:hypothetical protein